jgi:ATP-binding cassette subfamily A (ABC1) protein 3
MPLNVSLNKTDMFYASNLSENGIGWYAIQSRSSYALYADTKYKDSPPVLLNQLNRQILDSYSDASITVTLDPLPMTAEQRDLRRSVSGIGALFTFSLGLSFIPASIISFVVKEKQVAMKH